MSLELLEAINDGKYKEVSSQFSKKMAKLTSEGIEKIRRQITGSALVEGEEIVESNGEEAEIKIDVSGVSDLEEATKALKRLGVESDLEESEKAVYVEDNEDNREIVEAWSKRFNAEVVLG